MTTKASLLRLLGVAFFASHIPATLLVDAQALLPSFLFPRFAKNMLRNFIAQYGDPLMSAALRGSPDHRWFVSLIATELVLQLPFFFVALYAFLARREFIRLPLIAYGSFVSATMVPILSELWWATGLDAGKRVALLGMYLPYLIVPAIMVIWGCSAERLFDTVQEGGERGRRARGKEKHR